MPARPWSRRLGAALARRKPRSPYRPRTIRLSRLATEEREGKVRIGRVVATSAATGQRRTNANGEKILINMRPSGKKWSGRIHDPKGGSTYDSTIAMKGPDRLRVRGCAFGGMFCGGQTWTRVE